MLRIILIAFLMFSNASIAIEIPEMAKVVREEALRLENDPIGRPLPLFASWERETLPPSEQVKMITNGAPLIPWVNWESRYIDSSHWRWPAEKEQNAIKTFKDWNIPFAMLNGRQWEEDFYKESEYIKLPVEQTGVGQNLDGSKMQKVSPLSPDEPWKDLGKKWTANPFISLIQSLYPDPPLVILISNNEAERLRYLDANTEKRFVDSYGLNADNELKRKVFGDGWIKKYTNLFVGLKDGLTQSSWKNNLRVIGYNSYVMGEIGRWWNWQDYALTINDRLDPNWYSWDGADVAVYDNANQPTKTAYTLYSTQSESMNLVFTKKEAFKIKPNFWFELIVWDGYNQDSNLSKYTVYERAGIDYTPELYRGWVQYSMWLLTPRVVREFRYSASEPASRFMPYLQETLNSTKRVHSDPILSKFWRKGELVANHSGHHPFKYNFPSQWSSENRWFHLTTNLDPDGDSLSLQWPIWTLSRVIGSSPSREWIIYAYSPMGLKSNVIVTVPEYKNVNLPTVTVGGSFYYINEATSELKEVGVGNSFGDNLPAPIIKALK